MKTRIKAKKTARFVLCTVLCCSIGGLLTVCARAGAGVTRERKLEHIPNSCNVWAQNILYTGTSVSTAELESLRFKVN